ncbi:amino acid ABC transporter permease [Bacillus suaedae]|uniref:Amino acid ABC transporter permease n=1 Tax=Halalkalibacter suaedae TaxID=2822140 RepID=A0A940WYJ2_9BACI|nr:amino acid ABC transporter permease [Bacillus suaedae]MBP3950409.1 amino acid ABC transporter permease [Bacillus suaedae]
MSNTNSHLENIKLKPTPIIQSSPLVWLHKNLFSSWFNTLFTIVISIVLVLVITSSLRWVFVSANWSVVSENYKLFIVGQYPIEELWRAWSSLTLVSILVGLSAGLYKGLARVMMFGFLLLYGVSLVLPFIAMDSRFWLSANITIIIALYFLVIKMPFLKKFTWVLWILAFPIAVFLLHGFNVLPTVKTNIWGGFLLTIIIALFAIVVSFPIGVLLALGRTSKLPIIKWLSVIYIEVIRGVPLITVLFMAQIMIPLFLPSGISVDNLIRVMIGLTLFNAAYVAENIRGGLQSIPNSQYEASKALGLSTVKMTFFIILPQALRVTVPSMVGQSISILKDTTLIAIVGLVELLGIARSIIANPQFLGTQMEVFLFIAFVFWVICYFMSYMSRQIEKQISIGSN